MRACKMLSTNVLCIKKKKKKSYFVGHKLQDGLGCSEKTKRSVGGPATMLQITEDTPPDMLAGAMDLAVHLPNGRTVKMSVERSTPMMDLLVQITTNYHLQLSGYTLQALEMAPSNEHRDNVLPYKPNTPIGALDTQNIRVVPKTRTTAPAPKNVPPGQKPFESTFRLKVHLPRNQLFVTRVSQSVLLEDVMKKVCEEKNLDAHKYEFRHPGNLDETLEPKLTLSDYAVTEIHLVQKGTTSRTFSSGDIMALRKEEERKQMHNKTGGGVFNLIFRRGGKSSTGSLSSENRSISPTHSDDSRSVTPPAVPQPVAVATAPKPPLRKRRPAPKPPAPKSTPDDGSLTICHSRNSSDSSGYHEASVLSDNLNASLPRRPKSTMVMAEEDAAGRTTLLLSGRHSQSTSNLSKAKSASNLALPSRKKKSAPPPPPPPPPAPVLKPEKTETNLEEPPSPVVVASQSCTVARTESISTYNSQPTPLESLNSLQPPPPPSPSPPPPEEKKPDVIPPPPAEPEPETDWQYQLPSPPKAFRDSASPAPPPLPPDVPDSVVTSPELFEKLKAVKDSQSEKEDDTVSSMVSEEERPILNKLSLENLEKRKSLVYNRELATSLKMSEEKDNAFNSSLISFEKTYDEVVKKSSPQQQSTLPNFKITTYNNPKQKLNIFEDDTVRSSNSDSSKRNSFVEATFPLQKNYVGTSMENVSFRKNSLGRSYDEDADYKFYRPPMTTTTTSSTNVFRSESFSKEQTWTPFRPVARSKSQVVLNKYKEAGKKTEVEAEVVDGMAKSNSLFDVSGLQSLEVMRVIQNKLNTPNTSTEQLDRVEEPDRRRPEPEKPPPVTSKPYVYTPPSINMGTWSERPKVPVNVKEDPDYKFGVKKLAVTTVTNDLKSYNGVTVTVGGTTDNNKVNGFEQYNRNSGNVVIKIGGDNHINNNNSNTVFRKPLGNVNGDRQRPHSAVFDASRVPIVRSVEFKKPYKDFQSNNNNNTSVTRIYSAHEEINTKPEPPKPVFRVNSFLQGAPVVRGFNNTWNQPRSFSTLPAKTAAAPKHNYLVNAPVPFSQSNLRKAPPPAPGMPPPPTAVALKASESPKEQLLQAIRDFGGKKGLRAVKA